MITIRTVLATALVALAPAVLAHHGWSEYDAGKPLAVEGTVRASGYEHPHGTLQLESGGKTWKVVLAPPSRMENRGLAASAIKPGVQARVEGYPHRTDAAEMRAERITVDGKTVELR